MFVSVVLSPRNTEIKATKRCIVNLKSQCFILKCFSNWIMLVFLRLRYWWNSIIMGFAGRYFLLISPHYIPFSLLKNAQWAVLTKVVLYSQLPKLWAVLVRASIHFFQPLPGRANLLGWKIILFLWSLLLNCTVLCVIWLEWCKSVMCHNTSNAK